MAQSTRVVIGSAAGKLGAQILARAKLDPSIEVLGTWSRRPSEGARALDEMSDWVALESFVFIESGNAAAFEAHWSLIQKLKKSCIIATTGLHDKHLESLKSHAKHAAVMIAPNLSLGVALLNTALKSLSRHIPQNADISLVDIHHRQKLDAPSGTAKKLVSTLEAAFAKPISIHSIRGGDVIGEHTVDIYLDQERLSFTHRAHNREVFAVGAIKAAKFIATATPGLYTMEDMIQGERI